MVRSEVITQPTTPRRRVLNSSSPHQLPARGNWLHLCNGLDPVRDGGMVPSILGMTGALGRLHGEITIVTPTPSQIDKSNIPAAVSLHGPEKNLETSIHDAEIIHLHGLWQSHTRRGARTARAARIPYLITAHGMAEPWALRHKRWKKRVYLALVESRNLRRASCLHALSRPEIEHLRNLAPWAPICFIPNGVDLAPFDNMPSRALLESEYPELAGKFILLFFGRVHTKKGLDLLAEALSRTVPAHSNIHLIIAGKDDGALSPFYDRLSELSLTRRVTYLGHASGERARQVWAAADAFVLPSYSEGFSMAILEAMACRLPCLITSTCHFPEASAAAAAIEVDANATAITHGLHELLEMTPNERSQLGANARILVEAHYTWDRQAHRLASVYNWLLGDGPAPETVEQ